MATFHNKQSSTNNRSKVVRGLADARKRHISKRSGARQLALSCDPIVLFEVAPDLVLKFTILCSRQSLCDLVRSWYRVELRSHRSFGVKVHQLANLEFVFVHAGIDPPMDSPSCATGRAGNTGSGYPTRSAVASFCVMSDTGNGSAPGVMATRARAVHHRQRTARQKYYRGDNQ